MIDFTKHIIFCKRTKFLQELLIQQFVAAGMSGSDVYTQEKKEKDQTFFEKLAQKPMFGVYSLGFKEQINKEYNNDDYNVIIDKFQSSEHAYLVFLFDRLPGRLTARIKNNVYFRDDLEEVESEELLNNYLTILHKKISTDSRKFLINQMQQAPERVMPTLSKIASYTPHLYLDGSIIKNSFDELMSAFEVPERFFKSRGKQSTLILDKIEYNQFVPLFLGFLMKLIQFKIAEKKTTGEKMKIIKAHPAVIEHFSELVKQYTPLTLENMFLYYSEAAKHDKDVFIIRHLTRPKM